MTTAKQIVIKLRGLKNERNIAGMRRFGIQGQGMLGISTPTLRALARTLKKEYKKEPKVLHMLAEELWQTGIHEARILAAFIDIPSLVTKTQMSDWVQDFDSWDVCDQVCGNLFDRTPHAFAMAKIWSQSRKEFVKRAGYAMMATLAVHDKVAQDREFITFFPYILAGATDERNFVKKAVNWAVRQIGKRNVVLRKQAIDLSAQILHLDTPSAKWIVRDALRELNKK
jgi:3-methyladenine DNA glycosylase AlkD